MVGTEQSITPMMIQFNVAFMRPGLDVLIVQMVCPLSSYCQYIHSIDNLLVQYGDIVSLKTRAYWISYYCKDIGPIIIARV